MASVLKRCSGCRNKKPRSCFVRDRSRSDGLKIYCRDCASERDRKYDSSDAGKRRRKRYRANSQQSIKQWRLRNKHRARGYNLKAKFGITVDEYEELLELQDHKCAICGFVSTDEKPL